MPPEPVLMLAEPWGDAFPRSTTIDSAIDLLTIDTGRHRMIRIWVRTGALCTTATIPDLTWSSPPAEHAANWRAWDLLFWRHWWRLAHDRGGYA